MLLIPASALVGIHFLHSTLLSSAVPALECIPIIPFPFTSCTSCCSCSCSHSYFWPYSCVLIQFYRSLSLLPIRIPINTLPFRLCGTFVPTDLPARDTLLFLALLPPTCTHHCSCSCTHPCPSSVPLYLLAALLLYTFREIFSVSSLLQSEYYFSFDSCNKSSTCSSCSRKVVKCQRKFWGRILSEEMIITDRDQQIPDFMPGVQCTVFLNNLRHEDSTKTPCFHWQDLRIFQWPDRWETRFFIYHFEHLIEKYDGSVLLHEMPDLWSRTLRMWIRQPSPF